MRVWKPLLIIVPAGLTLGAIGGHYARPVMTQRAADDPAQQMFTGRGERGDVPSQVDIAYQNQSYYDGGPSYLPGSAVDDRTITGWQGPDFADWPDYKPAPLPTIDQLEAQVAARDAALGRRAMASAGERSLGDVAVQAADAAGEAASAKSDSREFPDYPPARVEPRSEPPSTVSAEPRTADGKLPAIW